MAATLSDSLRRDFRTAFRSLRRTPAFTITAVLILASASAWRAPCSPCTSQSC